MKTTRKRIIDLPEHAAKLWERRPIKKSYDVVIIGAGGHGLATAYYLAKNHGITNVAVLDRSWLGGGNLARNTTVIRSNYLWSESIGIYDLALSLWENLEEEVGYDMFFSQRGVMTLAHHVSDVRTKRRNYFSNKICNVDTEWLEPEEAKKIAPFINISPDVRYPILGATYQSKGGIAKHDWVAWGYAKAASDLGVDIIENCEVTGFEIHDGKVVGLETTKGKILCEKVGLAAAGHTSVLAEKAGFDVPLQSRSLQALVSELLEPVLDTVVMSGTVHVYVSQAHKGELVIGAGTDSYVSYSQRGRFHIIEHQLASALELFPIFERAHLLRTWGGIVDVCPDASPILGKTPVQNLYVNAGWGTGGFKSIPGSGWVYADTIANDMPHELAKPYSLDRFVHGYLIDEHGAAGVAH